MAIRSLLAALAAAATLSVAEAAAQAETECVAFEGGTHDLGELALLADACFRAGRYFDAELYLFEIQEQIEFSFAPPPEEFRRDSLYWLGVTEARLGNLELAIEVLSEAIDGGDWDYSSFWSNEWRAHYELGLAYAALGKPESAAARFTSALSESPRDDDAKAEIFYRRALARFAARNANGALDDLDSAIAMHEAGVFYGARGEIYLYSQNYAAAKSDLDRALALGLPHPALRARAYQTRGAASSNLQDYDGAVADYTRVIDMADAPAAQRLDARLSRALIHHLRRDAKNAMADYDAFFTHMSGAGEQTRAKAGFIVQGLKRAGLYNGNGESYDAALQGALAQCVASPECRF